MLSSEPSVYGDGFKRGGVAVIVCFWTRGLLLGAVVQTIVHPMLLTLICNRELDGSFPLTLATPWCANFDVFLHCLSCTYVEELRHPRSADWQSAVSRKKRKK